MKWHLLDLDGRIVRTVDAQDRSTAERLLGPGSVVSDVSYRLDVHKFKRVETVVTEKVCDQRPRQATYRYKRGWRRIAEIAVLLGARENQIRHLIDRYRIPFEVAVFGGRKVRFYHSEAVKQIKRRLDNIQTNPQPRSTVDKRRRAVLEFHRKRYAKHIHGRNPEGGFNV